MKTWFEQDRTKNAQKAKTAFFTSWRMPISVNPRGYVSILFVNQSIAWGCFMYVKITLFTLLVIHIVISLLVITKATEKEGIDAEATLRNYSCGIIEI